MNLLHIDSSLFGDASISRQLTAAVVGDLRAANPGAVVTYRDLAARPPAHLNGELLQALRPAPGSAAAVELPVAEEVAATEEMIKEFLAAQIVVLGAPMYNFSIPTPLKSWIDRIAQPGRTFRYTADGPVGLAGGKQVVVVSSRGGALSGTPGEAVFDHQEAYLRTILNFFGITDIHYVRAEGLAISPERRMAALEEAERDIRQLKSTQRRVA